MLIRFFVAIKRALTGSIPEILPDKPNSLFKQQLSLLLKRKERCEKGTRFVHFVLIQNVRKVFAKK